MTQDVLFAKCGAAGVITLNRPAALNAVTHDMVRAMTHQLTAWANDPSVTRVVIKAEGERAFSAGGDIRAIYDAGTAGRQADVIGFWREEYQLNTQIKRFPKPYIALIDGIVMGGGVGISIHGSHRVAGDKFLFAMPEVNIGFFPDVGATYFLPRLPGEIGTWCALTGDRMKADDGVATGIASVHVPSASFGDLVEALTQDNPVDQVLAKFAKALPPGPVTARHAAIDRAFTGDSVEDILANLKREAESGSTDAEWAAKTHAHVASRAPMSLRIALEQVRRGKHLSFEECMKVEFRIVSRIIYDQDFYEGIRAAIIDKSKPPVWHPATLAEASAADVERHFAPLGADELQLP